MGREWQKFHNLNFANDTISVQNEKELYFDLLWFNKSSVIRQKGESQSGCFKKTKHAKFSEKRTFLTLWYAHVRLRIRE